MTLLDTLRRRAGQRGRTAQVDCGALGQLTVEALPPAECARLGADPRGLLYAACRQLQQSGESLRREGLLFRPDEIMDYLSGPEVSAGAQAVLTLSGVSSAEELLPESVGLAPEETNLSEIRPASVQPSGKDFYEIRHESVQGTGTSPALTKANRPASVQESGAAPVGSGQVSREAEGIFSLAAPSEESGKKAQILGDLSVPAAQIVGRTPSPPNAAAPAPAGAKGTVHEIKSELKTALHETESDFGRFTAAAMHETESEFPEALHEIESESGLGVHEIRLELRELLHEIKSEIAAEAAEQLAEELQRAACVR